MGVGEGEGDGCEVGRRECLTQTNAESSPFAFGTESKRRVIDTLFDTLLTHISRQLSCGACFSLLFPLRLKHTAVFTVFSVFSQLY